MRSFTWQLWLIPVLLAPGTVLSAQPSARAVVSRAVRAIGGEPALRGLRNKVVEFHNVSFGLGQEETALSPACATIGIGRTVTDFAGGRMLTTQEIRLVNGVVNRQRRVGLTTMSLLENNGVAAMEPPNVVAGLERAMTLPPERILLAALDRGDALSLVRPRSLRGEMADGVLVPLGADTVTMWFDRHTGLPVATETFTNDDVLGDRRTINWYTRWQDAGGLVLPRQADTEVNGRLLSHTVFPTAAVNQTLDPAQFAIPDSMASRAPRIPAGPPAIAVTMVELGAGVWRAEGGSHHSLVVEQGRGLLVVEAPQSAARSAAVLDTLRRRFPNQPVTAVVLTHHHHDHSGGLRAYQARGIRVVAHYRNAEFVRTVAAARKTVAPDRLSRGDPAPGVTSVRDSLTLGAGAGRVVLYPIPSIHAEGILAAWVPSAGILFTSDVVNPPANQPLPAVGSRELAGFARGVGIAPRRYSGGHGATVDWSAIEAAAQP
jgi:glyoxylase-like metal-dependent hydrolase (beta-lactamase superfamily II)